MVYQVSTSLEEIGIVESMEEDFVYRDIVDNERLAVDQILRYKGQ